MMMRVNHEFILLFICLAQAALSTAFVSLTPQSSSANVKPLRPRHTAARWIVAATSETRRFSSQWDDEEEEVRTKPSTFEEAGETLKQEEDNEKMNSLGDFDANPSYTTDSVERIREQIKKRAESLGIEQSQEQIEYRKNAEERAKAAMEQRRLGGGADQMQQLLDLSQITNDARAGQGDDGVPTLFYDPESELSDEEKAEADPVGELPLLQQAVETLKKADFPSFWSATTEVFTLVFSILLTASIFIGYDYVIRQVYQYAHILPTDEEIQKGIEQRTKRQGMQQANEKDLMEGLKNFQEDIPSEL